MWTYGFYHGDESTVREIFKTELAQSRLADIFKYVKTNLATLNSVRQLEFHPFINSRVHSLKQNKSNILNREFKEQYNKYLEYLV